MKITKKYIVALVLLVMALGGVVFASQGLFAKTEKVTVTQTVNPGYYWCQHSNGTWSTYSEIDGTKKASNYGGVPAKTRVKTFANVTMPTTNWKSKETGQTINFSEVKNIKLTNVTLGNRIDTRMEAQVSIDQAKQQVIVNAYSGGEIRNEPGNFCGKQKGVIYPYPIVVTWEGEITKNAVSYIMEPKEFTLNVGEKGQFKVYEIKNNDPSTKKLVEDWKISWTTGDWQKVSVGTNGSVTGKLPTPEKVPIHATIKETNETLTGYVYVKKDPNDVPPPPAPEIPDPEPIIYEPTVTLYGPKEVVAGELFELQASAYSQNGHITNYGWVSEAEGSFINDKGTNVYFKTEGTKNVTVNVIDNLGKWASDTIQIEVTAPKPQANITVGGTLKENRKVTIEAFSTSPEMFPIDNAKSYIEIKPTENTRLAAIKFTGIKDSYKKANSYQIPFSDMTSINALFKQQGTYELDVYVVNTAGYSDRYSERNGQALTIEIAEDQKPIAEFSAVSLLYRDPENQKKAQISVINQAYSPDNDRIDKVVYEIVYDKNNDGVFDEKPLVIDSSVLVKNEEDILFVSDVMVWVTLDDYNNLEFFTNRVGRYDISQTVYEKFGQETIEEFITEADYLFTRYE